jgi:hypothetical protein
MEDDLNFLAKERRPGLLGKLSKLNNLNMLAIKRRFSFLKMEGTAQPQLVIIYYWLSIQVVKSIA